MPVILKFQSTGAIPGKGEPVKMTGPSLTIGRGKENDLVLPDTDRMLSKRHCAVEDHNGNVVAVDFSTNGTFLNYGKLALGSTPTPLNDGDILSLGPYELLVGITSDQPAERIADPLDDAPISHGQATGAPSSDDLMDAPGDGGDFIDDLLGGREGPVGPRDPEPDAPDTDGLLPPLGEEEDIEAPAADPHAGQGASTGRHAPSAQDQFRAPHASEGGQSIPDDWDDDLIAPRGDHSDPFARQAPAPDTGGAGTADSAGAAFIPDDFEDDLLAGTPAPDAAQDPDPAPTSQPDPPEPVEPVEQAAGEPPADPVQPEPPPEPQAAPDPQSVPDPQVAPPPMPPAPAPEDRAARAFLRALGAADMQVTDTDLEPTMARMGHVLRIMIEGMREILMTRTSIKSEFRIEQTMIQAGGNNPLKFSISPEQAIEAMVKMQPKGYLDAADAADQALSDIKAHEVAMVTGMESAIKGLLGRLDPKALEGRIATGGGVSSVLKSKKARYWEIYEDMYAEIADQAENDFHDLFAREFARAYKEQLDKLK